MAGDSSDIFQLHRKDDVLSLKAFNNELLESSFSPRRDGMLQNNLMSFLQSYFISSSQMRGEHTCRILGQWFILPLCIDFQFPLELAVPDEKTGNLQS